MSATARVLTGLVAGIVIGMLLAWTDPALAATVAGIVEPFGKLWINAYPGTRLLEGMATSCARLSDDLAYQLQVKTVETKEYPEGQTAYSVEFFRKGERLFY